MYRPSDIMRRMQEEIERLKREAGFDSIRLFDDNMGIVPRKDAFEVSLDVAGYKPEELLVNLNNDQLTLTGKHEDKSAEWDAICFTPVHAEVPAAARR